MKIDRKKYWDIYITLIGVVLSITSLIISFSHSFYNLKGNPKAFSLIAIPIAIIASVLSIYILRRKNKQIEKYNLIRDKKVFLSYVRQDKEKVKTVYHQLKSLGLNPWMDIENLQPGEIWVEKIEDAIKSSDLVLLCFSRASLNKSGFISKEIDIALKEYHNNKSNETILIPVKLDDSNIPPQLSMFQYADLTNKEGWDKLINTLKEKFNLEKTAHNTFHK